MTLAYSIQISDNLRRKERGWSKEKIITLVVSKEKFKTFIQMGKL
jgi:hypothetical protein